MFDCTVDFLSNGLVSILDRQSGLRGLYRRDGGYVSGDFHIAEIDAYGIILAGAL